MRDREAELAQSESLAEQKTKDVSTMHACGTRHADCLRSLSQALQPIAEKLRQQGRDVSDDSRVVDETRELEQQVGHLTEVLTVTSRCSQSIEMHRRPSSTSTETNSVASAAALPTMLQQSAPGLPLNSPMPNAATPLTRTLY
jgi:bacterioferritin-associated ferredoxin